MKILKELPDLTKSGVDFEVISHEHTERAADEAAALGVKPDAVAKTVVLKTRDGFARAVLPASERLDLHRVREQLDGGQNVRLATEAELAEAYPDFELGAVPPVGGRSGDEVLVDPRIAAQESVLFEAGTHEQSVRMRADDLVALTRARVVDVCEW
jgi:Ala-tRNA(Pro) deacylase